MLQFNDFTRTMDLIICLITATLVASQETIDRHIDNYNTPNYRIGKPPINFGDAKGHTFLRRYESVEGLNHKSNRNHNKPKQDTTWNKQFNYYDKGNAFPRYVDDFYDNKSKIKLVDDIPTNKYYPTQIIKLKPTIMSNFKSNPAVTDKNRNHNMHEIKKDKDSRHSNDHELSNVRDVKEKLFDHLLDYIEVIVDDPKDSEKNSKFHYHDPQAINFKNDIESSTVKLKNVIEFVPNSGFGNEMKLISDRMAENTDKQNDDSLEHKIQTELKRANYLISDTNREPYATTIEHPTIEYKNNENPTINKTYDLKRMPTQLNESFSLDNYKNLAKKLFHDGKISENFEQKDENRDLYKDLFTDSRENKKRIDITYHIDSNTNEHNAIEYDKEELNKSARNQEKVDKCEKPVLKIQINIGN